jgi:hypothetical protein
LTKEPKRATTLVEIKPELFHILEEEYNETRPKAINFTAYINGIMTSYVKRKVLLKKKFPHLSVIAADPNLGLYVKDHKRDLVAELEFKLESKELIRCKLDKSSNCDHYLYAVLCSLVMRMLPDSYVDIDTKENSDKHMIMV